MTQNKTNCCHVIKIIYNILMNTLETSSFLFQTGKNNLVVGKIKILCCTNIYNIQLCCPFRYEILPSGWSPSLQ